MTPSYLLRPGTPEDTYPAFVVFRYAIAVVYHQYHIIDRLEMPGPEQLADDWRRFRSLYGYLETHVDRFWVAEQEGRVIGYARSALHDGMRELTELFIHPQVQSHGLGKELLRRVFPLDEDRRMIIATADPRAQALYLRSDVYARHPIYTFYRMAQKVAVESDLVFQPLSASMECVRLLAGIDQAVLGLRRDSDHEWLLNDRKGFVAWRGDKPVGYGYVSEVFNGPFAAVNADDQPSLLAYAENLAAEAGWEEFGVDAPLVNRVAVRYLLDRGFQIGRFIAYHMSNTPFGDFERYLYTSPIFTL